MGSLLGEGSIFSSLGSSSGATTAAIVSLIFLALLIIVKITNLPIAELLMRFFRWIVKLCGVAISKKEEKYHRDLAIGKIDAKRKSVKLYRFLNDLIIDLQLKRTGVTPYEFFFLVCLMSFVGTMVFCEILFGGLGIAIIMFPIVTVGVFCTLYTRANVAHDARIEAVIEAENIICNNIKSGVLVAVKDSIDVVPKQLRGDFKDFIDNVEQKNYHIKTALMELNASLGSVADDFIKKCIVFELEEEHGIAEMFKDIVEMNNIKMKLRTDMKRQMEQVVSQFKIGAAMIIIFLFGVMVVYKEVRLFYLKSWLGQMILALDVLLFIIEYVYITYLRAKEL